MSNFSEFPQSLIGLLGDQLGPWSIDLVLTLRLPCTVGDLPEGASDVVKLARSYLHGFDDNLICSLDYRVTRTIKEDIRDRAPEHLLFAEEEHLALGLCDHERGCVILLGGLDTRYLVESEKDLPVVREGRKFLGDFKRIYSDRSEVKMLDWGQYIEIIKDDPAAFEKALCLKPIT